MGVGLATGSNKKTTKNISHSSVSSLKGFNKVETEKPSVDSLIGKNLDSIRDLTDDLVILDVVNDSLFEIKSLNKKEDSNFWDSFDQDKQSKNIKAKVLETIDQLESNNKHKITTDRSLINESLDREFNKETSRNNRDQDRNSFNKFDRTDRRPNKTADKSVDLNTKFAGAKSISSAQLFGNDREDFEVRNSSNRFQGSDSISSDQYFGRETQNKRNSYTDALSSTNLYDIKEGVRDGVSKVAGRLSNFANDMWERYGSN